MLLIKSSFYASSASEHMKSDALWWCWYLSISASEDWKKGFFVRLAQHVKNVQISWSFHKDLEIRTSPPWWLGRQLTHGRRRVLNLDLCCSTLLHHKARRDREPEIQTDPTKIQQSTQFGSEENEKVSAEPGCCNLSMYSCFVGLKFPIAVI